MGTRHSESTSAIASMGRSEAGGLNKQPKKTAQGKKNEEAAVGSNTITRFFGRKAPQRRVGRTKKTKGQRGSVNMRGKSTSESTSKLKLSKAKTTGKSNISLGNGTKNNEEENKKKIKWSAEYLYKVQKC